MVKQSTGAMISEWLLDVLPSIGCAAFLWLDCLVTLLIWTAPRTRCQGLLLRDVEASCAQRPLCPEDCFEVVQDCLR